MEPEEDAFGELLYDCYTSENPAGEIIEREDGFINYAGSAKNYFDEYDDWSTQVQDAITHTHGKAVDIGCGAGRHTLHLQQDGYDIRGIDTSPKAIQLITERGVEKGSTAGIDDVHTLPEAPYDTVLLLGCNLGLLGTKPVERLNYLAEQTTDEGVLIGQTREATGTDQPELLQYHDYNRVRGRRPGCIKMRTRYKHFTTPWFNYLFLDETELDEILAQTPWTITEKYTSNEKPTYTVILEKDE